MPVNILLLSTNRSFIRYIKPQVRCICILFVGVACCSAGVGEKGL